METNILNPKHIGTIYNISIKAKQEKGKPNV